MKLLIKIEDLSQDVPKSKWVHLCYVSTEACREYKEKKPEEYANLNATIARWTKEDFGEELYVATAEDLENLKTLVKNYCKEAYPEVYLDQTTDRQGWLRVWLNKKMKEDLYGKQSK